MTDTQFGALMVLVGGVVTTFFTYLGVHIKERIAAKGTVTVAGLTSQDAFIGRLMGRLDAVEKAADECEKRCAEQIQIISKQSIEMDTMRRERLGDKGEIESMQSQIQVLRRTNRRLEERISQMERRQGID